MEPIGVNRGSWRSVHWSPEKQSGLMADRLLVIRCSTTHISDDTLEASAMFHLLKDRLSTGTVLDRHSFIRQIRREKARSDRSGIPFSLIAVSAGFDTPTGKRLFSDIVHFSRERLRITDDYGQLGPRTFGILLPITSTDGARVVAREYAGRFEGRIKIETYSYPDAWMFDDLAGRPSLESAEDEDDELANHFDSQVRSRAMRPLMERKLPIWKRAIDILATGIGLMVLAPVLVLLALLIKISSPGPVFFTQMRAGRGGKPFRIFKFRSMVVDAERLKRSLAALNEQDGPAFKIKNDPRITPIGNFMRRTSLDELPQLWNVFRGDMTLVGPRPLPCDESAACEPWQLERLQVTPGLTCIWQVYGRSRVTFDEWMRMDLDYIRNCSLALDLKLIWMTVWTSLVKKNGM